MGCLVSVIRHIGSFIVSCVLFILYVLRIKSQSRQEKNEVHYNGLKNQGATCYLNTVLQCLFMTKEFRKPVESQSCDGLLLQLKKVFEQLKEGEGNTKAITQSLGINNVCEQQDAVEYYQKIIKEVGPQLPKVFEGKMSNSSKCTTKNHMDQQSLPFITIPLAIESEQNEVYSVKEGLETFFSPTVLDEDNWLYCDQCDEKTETKTWMEIEKFPTVLSLHLKRFDFDYRIMSYVKNNCPVDIPMNLDSVQDKPYRYNLYAVINHKGSKNGGHYNAIIKSFENNEWYSFDDSSVTQASESSLHHSRLAYLLLYRKDSRFRGQDSGFFDNVTAWVRQWIYQHGKVILLTIGLCAMCLLIQKLCLVFSNLMNVMLNDLSGNVI